METKKIYEQPKFDVVEMKMTQILCASGEGEDPITDPIDD